MTPKERAEAFSKDFDELLKKHIGSLDPNDAKAFASHLQQSIPVVTTLSGTLATISATMQWPPDKDTDPPD